MVQFHARRLQTAWESLAELFKGNDYGASLQLAVLVAAGHVYLRMLQMAILYIQHCKKNCALNSVTRID